MNHFHPVYEALHCGATAGIHCTNPKDVTCPTCKQNERNQKRITISFSRLKFVDSHGLYDQMLQMASEMDEVGKAYVEPGYNRLAEETADLMQSCATLMYMLEEKHGIDPQAVMTAVQIKNRARGYEGPQRVTI